MSGRNCITLAAGGTGGHMFPAHALGIELEKRGYRVTLVSDARGLKFPGLLEGMEKHRISAGSISRGGILGRLRAGFDLLAGIFQARKFLIADKPQAVVGFGGYPALPTILAARWLGIPYCIHEQNSVLGRVNRMVAGGASSVALSFTDTAKISRRAANRAVVTGNPVREEIAALAAQSYPAVGDDSMFRVLVLGGSQGARILSDVVPAALAMMPGAARKRFQVTQQCREEDLQRVRKTYSEAGIAAEVGIFFEDMPERLQWTHFVISRAGASTISELTAAGRPSILVPLAIATDDHQTTNAKALVEAGGAWLFTEDEFTPAALAKRVQKLALNPEALTRAAAATRAAGMPDATRLLADLVVGAAVSGEAKDHAVGAKQKTDNTPESQSRRAVA